MYVGRGSKTFVFRCIRARTYGDISNTPQYSAILDSRRLAELTMFGVSTQVNAHHVKIANLSTHSSGWHYL